MTQPTSSTSVIKDAVRAALPETLWTALRRLRLRWTLATFPRRTVEHVYAGTPLRILISDPLSSGWYDQDWPEPPAIELLRRHRLREGAVVFNIGAHQGVIGLILANIVGRAGRVVALEAMPFNVKVACRNRDLNDTPQLTVVHGAIAEQNGQLLFSPDLNGVAEPAASGWGKVAVEALTIDEMTRRYGAPDVLFLDIEGYECRALRGAARTLALRSDWVIEVHVGTGLESFGGSLEEVLRFFPPDAYTLFMAPDSRNSETEPGFRPLEPSDDLVKGLFQLVAVGRR